MYKFILQHYSFLSVRSLYKICTDTTEIFEYFLAPFSAVSTVNPRYQWHRGVFCTCNYLRDFRLTGLESQNGGKNLVKRRISLRNRNHVWNNFFRWIRGLYCTVDRFIQTGGKTYRVTVPLMRMTELCYDLCEILSKTFNSLEFKSARNFGFCSNFTPRFP